MSHACAVAGGVVGFSALAGCGEVSYMCVDRVGGIVIVVSSAACVHQVPSRVLVRL
jgi:hypothetical protein